MPATETAPDSLALAGECAKPKDAATSDTLWQKLRLPHFEHDHPPIRNVNDLHDQSLSPLDKFAVKITNKIGDGVLSVHPGLDRAVDRLQHSGVYGPRPALEIV